MAAREHFGYQATIIVLVMLVILFSVGTYFGVRSADENARLAEAEKKKSEDWQKKYNDENFKVQFVQHVLGTKLLDNVAFQQVREGARGDEDMKRVDNEYEKFRKAFEKAIPEGQAFSFLALPEIMLTAIRLKQEALVDRDSELNSLRDKTKQLVDSEVQARKVSDDVAKKAATDLQDQIGSFTRDRNELQKKQEDQLNGFQQQRLTIQKKVDDVTKLVTNRDKEIVDLKKTNQSLRDKLDATKPNVFETKHGEIVRVNEITKSVWINLGISAGLRRQVTFSVFDHDATGIDKAKQKGKIEVVQVVGQNLAECRVIEEADVKVPILPGDQIFSPAWRPGRQVHFAIVGFIDANGDGYSDRELVRSLINMNAGTVDFEVEDDGQIEGKLKKITAQTDYLVLGESPAGRRVSGDESKKKANEEANKQYNAALDQAKVFETQRISVAELLSLMGWKGGLKKVPIGRSDGGDDFKTGQPAPSAPKERKPPAGADGAF